MHFYLICILFALAKGILTERLERKSLHFADGKIVIDCGQREIIIFRYDDFNDVLINIHAREEILANEGMNIGDRLDTLRIELFSFRTRNKWRCNRIISCPWPGEENQQVTSASDVL